MKFTLTKPFTANLMSGFLVSLLALPLSLGIAVASGFPPLSGVFTAIIAGLVCTFFAGCDLAIKGPAAGLIVIITGAVQVLGGENAQLGYLRCLSAIVVAGGIQMVLSFVGFSRIAFLFPTSVVHGMLSAIGAILICKQLPIFFGIAGVTGTPLEILHKLPQLTHQINPVLFILGVASLLYLRSTQNTKVQILKKVPPSIIVVIFGLIFSEIFQFKVDHSYSFFHRIFQLGPKTVLTLPTNIQSAFHFPLFDSLLTWGFWRSVVLIVIIGSLESLLTVTAIDSLTRATKETASDLNKDLFSVGLGNMLSALVGGLPMISEVVRSRANIDYKANSRYSNFFHGFFLLLFVLFLAGVLKEIPMVSLSALLISVGMNLCAAKEFKKFFSLGVDEFACFLTTLVLTVTVDLLVGVSVGFALRLLLNLVAKGRAVNRT